MHLKNIFLKTEIVSKEQIQQKEKNLDFVT
jgi:hypothetical protein